MASTESGGAEHAKAVDESGLRRRIYLLLLTAVLLPPFAGSALMIFAGYYPFPEFFGLFFNLGGLILVGFGALGIGLAPLLYRFTVSLPHKPPEDARRSLVRFRVFGPLMVLGFVVAYSVLGAVMADVSMARMGLIEHRISENLVVASGPIPVALLTAIPIYSMLIDTLARYLGPRGVILPVLPVRARMIMIGLTTPFLIDTLLVGYYYARTGFFTIETLWVWLVLLILAALGTFLMTQSVAQSLEPLQEFISRDKNAGASGILTEPIVGLSLDEHGEICKRLNEIRSVLQDLDSGLRDSEKRLREAERIARLGSWTADMDDNLLWSPEIFEIFGVDPADFTGKTEFFYDLVHPDERDRVRRETDDAIRTGEDITYVHRIIRPDGAHRTIFEKAEIERDPDGRPVRMVGIAQDISQTVEMEERLRQAQKMEAIGNLTGGVAHDFNNLLAVILGNLELIRDIRGEEEIDAFVDAAIRATERGADLTRNMLSFARRARLEPSILDLNQIVTETKQWAAPVLPENIDVETSLLAGLWKTLADQNSTQSALLNLVLNARDSMPSGGRLTIETSNVRIDEDYLVTRGEDLEPGRYVMLAVSDTGHGITLENMEQVFDPFFTTKPPGSGSGLGLSMVQGFMKQSGGTVRVYSEPGVGTTFKLYFRAEVAPAPQPPKGRSAVVTASLGKRILLVEDEADVLAVLQKTLTNSGYVVQTATSGDEAFKMFRENDDFDVLVTDIVMPGARQGTDLARELRENWPDLPVVFMSGYAKEAAVHGNGLHPEDIRLMKPVSRMDLVAAVETAVSRGAIG